MRLLLFIAFTSTIILMQTTATQGQRVWNNKRCAVVLTYDDALNVHLDNAIPALDAAGFKGTFYIIAQSEVLRKRLPEWRKAALNGHELGNHSLSHPCDASKEGRSWVSPETDLSKYSIQRTVNEIRVTNTLLEAIDGKTERTFAYPCGDNMINGENYYKELENEFVGARGVQSSFQQKDKINLNNIDCFFINNHSAEYMIDLVDKAIESGSLLVFLFHGVGGEHNIDVSLSAHNQLIDYLKKKENDIWVAPLVDVAKYVKSNQ